MVVTEIVSFPTFPNVKLGEDATGNSRKLWDELLARIKSQPGAQSVYWGVFVEKPEMVNLVVEWDKLSSHETYQSSGSYPALLRDLETLGPGPISMRHAQLAPRFDDIAKCKSNRDSATAEDPSLVLEMLTLFFPESYAEEGFIGAYDEFRQGLGDYGQKEGCLGVTGGWVVELVEHEKLGEAKGKAFVMVVAWESVEAHMKYRETDVFKQTIVAFREKAKAMEMHHTRFERVSMS